MLKIHPFLHEMKDVEASLGIYILKKRDKIAAPIIYVIVATLLILNFNYFNGFGKKTSELQAKAETIIDMIGEVEETQQSAILTTDMKQYTFSSLNLIKDISRIEKIEKLEELTDQTITNRAIQVFALGQFTTISTKEDASSLDTLQMSATIASEEMNEITEEKDNVIATSEASNNNQAKQSKESSKNTNKNNTEKNQTKEVLANGLVLTNNTAMKKKLSTDELEVLQRIVEAEATGEDIYGKILVANVVINRVNDEQFPDSISEVVFQKNGGTYQFSPTRDGRYWSVSISKSTIEAVSRALSGEDYSQGALYFFARKLTSQSKAQWFDESLHRLFRYGCHEFYKEQ